MINHNFKIRVTHQERKNDQHLHRTSTFLMV